MPHHITRWSKEFNQDNSLAEYLGEFSIDSNPGRKADTTFSNKVKNAYKIISSVIYWTEEMRKHDFANFHKWLSMEEFNSLVEFFDYDVEGAWGISTNFYSNNEFEKVYKLLLLLTEQGYDVRSEWKTFRQEMSNLWQRLPDFYKGMKTAEFVEHMDIPVDYDSNTPFPNLLIPTDIN